MGALDLAHFDGPGWRRKGGLAVRGRAFDGTGAGIDIRAAFERADSYASVVETASRLPGFFGVVLATADEIYLACDHARSIPLYFTTTSPLGVSDTASGLPVAGTATSFDPVAESEFVLTRYVTRGETLLPNVNSVRAGEVVRIPREDPSSFERYRYDRYRPTTRVEGDRELLLDRMADVVGTAFDRTVSTAGERPIAVPLSGGVDSRLVATMLVERGHDVIGFTFGRPGHADVEVSRDVAETLDIDWEWVEYSTDRWHEWYHSDGRRSYHEFAFNHDSLPFLAEWPAVHALLEDGRLPENALVCPGHTVATPSERVPARWTDTAPDRRDVLDYVLEEHYRLWEWDDPRFRRAFERRIAADASLGPVRSGGEAAAAYEQWEWATRMTTFTNGDTRVYDWFGLDWWLPLWDPAYVRFWETVPLSSRQGKALQAEFTARKYADVTGTEPDTARRTDRDWTPFDQVRRSLHTDPLAPFADGFEGWLGVQDVPPSQWEEWGNYPLGWYGVVPEDGYERFDAAANLYSLRTLEAIGRLGFDPPRVRDPPLEPHLDLPPSGWPTSGP